MKKLVLLGTVALVVLGCVIAAGCTGTNNATSLPTGEWICTNFVTDDGKTVTAIQTIKANGNGHWMVLNDKNPGFQIDKVYKSTFSEADQDGVFKKASSSGKSYYMVYDPEKDTVTQKGITQEEDNVYTRLEPIVGIWSETTTAKLGSGNATTIIKPDGTGLAVISYDDGTARVTGLTWTKNTDGTYAMVFNDGAKQTYTVAPKGKSLQTADGRTKIKESYYPYPIVSVTGPWYNKDSDRLIVFNGDGTGVGIFKNGVIKFTWGVNDIGKFALTYTEGTADDGSSMKGKTSEWTYDRDNDTFTSAKGTKYIRPTESIEGKLILA